MVEADQHAGTVQRVERALTPYGFTLTDEFWKRYETDTLVYSLVNIVIGQEEALRGALKDAMEQGVNTAFDALQKTLIDVAR
jgi:hypothetical protein